MKPIVHILISSFLIFGFASNKTTENTQQVNHDDKANSNVIEQRGDSILFDAEKEVSEPKHTEKTIIEKP